ncbi:MAG: sensor histidine kinase [Thermoplasmatota archaeon]
MAGAVRPGRGFSVERHDAELRLFAVGVGTVLFILYFSKNVTGLTRLLAYGLIVGGWLFTLYWVLAEWRHGWFPKPTMGVVAVADAVFILAWIYATGGVASPFYLSIYVALIALAFQLSPRGMVVASVGYGVAYTGLVVAAGQASAHWVDLATRLTYLVLIGAVGIALADGTRTDRRLRKELASHVQAVAESTEQLALRRRELEDAQALAHVGSWQWDPVRGEVTWSPEMRRIHGLGPGYPINETTAAGFVHAEDSVRVAAAYRASYRDNIPIALEYRLVRPDGNVRFVSALGAAMRDAQGKVIHVSGTVQDITEQRRAQEAERQAFRTEVEMQRLRAISESKTRVLNSASHELRTPLTPLKLQLHLLRVSVAQGDMTAAGRALDVLTRNLDRMEGLVNDFLDAASIQEGRFIVRPQRMNLASVVNDVIVSHEAQAHFQEVDLRATVEPDVWVNGDPNRLSQVLFNLLSNAFKFTPRSGTIRIHLSREGGPRDGTAILTIADSGPGLSPAQIQQLFEPFSRPRDAPQGGARGSGLGLFICKGIVEQHGGMVVCESAGEGKGTTFRVRLPIFAKGPATPGAANVTMPAVTTASLEPTAISH